MESFHAVNTDVPAGVGAPPLNTQVRFGGREDLGMRLQLDYCKMTIYVWLIVTLLTPTCTVPNISPTSASPPRVSWS